MKARRIDDAPGFLTSKIRHSGGFKSLLRRRPGRNPVS
jgi:hypothetical protein